jgi:hypothetical protein
MASGESAVTHATAWTLTDEVLDQTVRRGKVIAFGRKPWLGLRFGSVFIDG